jgi:glycosyltransferase involved in cell wall biosynthesis
VFPDDEFGGCAVLFGITRVRNESLILEDSLRHFSEFCEKIVLYDDCSTDNTVEIARSFANVIVIQGDEWRKDRMNEETRHRHIVMEVAVGQGAEWLLCFDADERLVGGAPDLSADAYTFRLYDGYMVDGSKPYTRGPLEDLPRMWGPEYRDIVMLFNKRARYDKPGQRQPSVAGKVEKADVSVKHYGKCLSVEHWEETCDYYAKHFPAKFAKVWNARRGKAIHAKSDFGRELRTWDDAIKNGVPL